LHYLTIGRISPIGQNKFSHSQSHLFLCAYVRIRNLKKGSLFHIKMIRLLAISGQLMANEEHVDICLKNGKENDNGQILSKFGAHIQSRLQRLQNPPDCDKARLLILKVIFILKFYNN
jgi:hypothetical protein